MTVVLIDDHPVLSLGLKQGLEARGVGAVAMAPAPPEFLIDELFATIQNVDLIVLDLAMPAVPDTAALVEQLVDRGASVLMLSGSDDQADLARCLLAGSLGVLAKDEELDVILDTIVDALSGRPIRISERHQRLQNYDQRCRDARSRIAIFDSLTPAEAEVLSAMMAGQGAASIAADRFVSLATVRTQIKAVLAKMGVSSQLEAVSIAHEKGFGTTENRSAPAA